jgi:hypothetical protein
VSEEQQVEVELEQSAIGLTQASLRRFRVVHQVIGYEAEPAAVMDDAVSAGERSPAREVQRRLVWADRVDLVGDGVAGKPTSEVEWLDRAAPFELIYAIADAVNGAAEALMEAP